MGRKEIVFGVLCIAGMLLIAAHSIMFGPEMMAEPPWVLEKTYFENLEKYSGKKIYIVAFIESVGGNRIAFTNSLGEHIEVETDTSGIEREVPVFMEVIYDSGTGKMRGNVLYRLLYGEERLEVSLIALAWVLAYYFVWKKKLRFKWRRLKVVVKDA